MPLKLLQRNKRIVFRDRENFLSRLAVLLREGYLLPTALSLLLPMHTPKLDEALDGVTSILKGGGNAAEILKFLGFKDNVLFPVEIAEHHGRLPESIDSISKSFSRTEQVQKKLLNILVYPVSLLFFTSGLFLFFRTSYVPNLEKLMASLNADGEGSGVPAYLLNLPDLFIGCFAVAGISAAAFAAMLKKRGPAQKIAWLTQLPVLRKIMVCYWSHLLSRGTGNAAPQRHLAAGIAAAAAKTESPFDYPIYGGSMPQRSVDRRSLVRCSAAASIFCARHGGVCPARRNGRIFRQGIDPLQRSDDGKD